MLSSISGFKTWQAPTKSYKEAVKAYETDLQQMKDLDSDQVQFGRPYADTDARKGEVQVAGVGSLHSTKDGFELKTLQKAESRLSYGACSNFDGGSRDYQVNTQTGTITVTNEVGSGFAVGSYFSGSVGGYTEKYILDTENGTLVDYCKIPRPLAGNLVGSLVR